MATYTPGILSGSTNGKGIKVTGTSGAASVDIHQAVNDTTDIDLVTIEVFNSDTAWRQLTLGWGAETSPDNLITRWVPPGEFVVVRYEGPLNNNLVITAWADTANVLIVYGSVLKANI